MNTKTKQSLDNYNFIEAYTFEHNNINMILDVINSNFYEINSTVYDVTRYKNNEIEYKDLTEKYKESEINNAIEDLINTGFMIKEIPLNKNKKISKDKEVVNLVMNISQDCNLRCKYCFASTGHYKGERTYMKNETAKRTLDWFANQAYKADKLNLHLFGGEPLMNIELVKFIVNYVKELEEIFNKTIYINICTNGTILDNDLLKLIKDNKIGIQISIDGPSEIHDKNRPTADGKSSYKIIKENLEKLFSELDKNSIIPRATIPHDNIQINKVVDHLLEMGFNSVFFIPAMGCDNFSIKTDDISKVKTEYNLLAEKFINHIKNGKEYNVFPLITEIDAIGKGIKRSYGCGAGIGFASVDVNGDIYPCMRFTNRERYKLGDIKKGFNSEQRSKFFDRSIYNRSKCKTCWARHLCGGACISIPTENGEDLESYTETTCEVSKHIAKISMYINAVLSKEGLKFNRSQLEVNDFMRRRFQ